jgi:hypothetical protein
LRLYSFLKLKNLSVISTPGLTCLLMPANFWSLCSGKLRIFQKINSSIFNGDVPVKLKPFGSTLRNHFLNDLVTSESGPHGEDYK